MNFKGVEDWDSVWKISAVYECVCTWIWVIVHALFLYRGYTSSTRQHMLPVFLNINYAPTRKRLWFVSRIWSTMFSFSPVEFVSWAQKPSDWGQRLSVNTEIKYFWATLSCKTSTQTPVVCQKGAGTVRTHGRFVYMCLVVVQSLIWKCYIRIFVWCLNWSWSLIIHVWKNFRKQCLTHSHTEDSLHGLKQYWFEMMNTFVMLSLICVHVYDHALGWKNRWLLFLPFFI